MGLLFRSKRRRGGGGILTWALIIGGLYYTGILPKAWEHIKVAGDHCGSALSNTGSVGQAVCGAVGSVLNGIDGGLESVGGSIEEMTAGLGEQFGGFGFFGDSSEGTGPSGMDQMSAQFSKYLSNFTGNGLTSSSATLDSLMKMAPGSVNFGGGEMGQMQGAMDSFAIAQKLMGSQPGLSMEWLQKGASMGAYGLPSQLSLGNSYAASGDQEMALAYFNQANQSLNMLQGSDSAAANKMLGGMSVSPEVLQQQIIAAIRQMQIGK